MKTMMHSGASTMTLFSVLVMLINSVVPIKRGAETVRSEMQP